LPRLQQLPELDAAFVVLDGEARYETVERLAATFPERIGARIGFNESLAHSSKGADLFLMPSRFEPCG